MRKKALLVPVAILVLVGSSQLGLASAKSDRRAGENSVVTPGGRTITLPVEGAVGSDGVVPLGFAVDEGRIVEGFAIFHPRRGYHHRPGHGGGRGGGESKCYAFMAKGARWRVTEPYLLDTTNLDGLSDQFVADRMDLSIDAWEEQVGFDIFGARGGGIVDGADTIATDGKNEVMFGNITRAGTIAVTIVWGLWRGPLNQRELVEFDLVFDDRDFQWGDAGPTSETQLGNIHLMDLQNVATHEFGHAAGLGHPSDACLEETMYRFSQNGETKRRTLAAGDIIGINELY